MGTSRRRTPPAPVSRPSPEGTRAACLAAAKKLANGVLVSRGGRKKIATCFRPYFCSGDGSTESGAAWRAPTCSRSTVSLGLSAGLAHRLCLTGRKRFAACLVCYPRRRRAPSLPVRANPGRRVSQRNPRQGRGFQVAARFSTQQQNEKDQRDRDSDEPEQNGHAMFLSV